MTTPGRDGGENSPIFIVGLPRSGTTLMRFMLCAHSRIAIAPETNYMNRWMRFYSHLDVVKPRGFEVFWSDFSRVELFRSFGIDPEATLKRIMEAGSPGHKTVFSSIAKEYAAGMGKPRWGEKTPKHEHYIDVLLGWFPKARVLFMLRDPRAVSASLLGKNWGGSYAVAHALRWRRSSARARRWEKDGRVRLVLYEELVTEPERVLRGICDVLDETFEPKMIHRPNVAGYLLHSREGSGQGAVPVVRPLDPAAIDRWRSRLTPLHTAMIEHVAGEEMRRRGYRLAARPLTPLQRALLSVEKVLAPVESLSREPFRRVIAARVRTYLKQFKI